MENKVGRLIEKLKSSSIDKMKDATEKIEELISHKHAMENKLLLVTCGAIKPLVSLILSPDLKIQENTVHILKTLSLVDEYCKEVAKADAIEPLIHVLSIGIPNARAHSAILLGKLSMIEDYNIKIGHSGAVKPLLELLTYGDTLGQECASYAVYRLSRDPENNVSILQAGIVKYLVDFMDSSMFMYGWIVGILWNLATIPNGRSEIWKNGGIPMLVKWLDLGSNDVKYFVVSTLLELCTNSNRFCVIILQQGAIQSLEALPQSGYCLEKKVK